MGKIRSNCPMKEVEDYSEGNGDNDPDAIPSPA